ncbi:acyltransferase [Thioclava sp. FTW29]|uniref:Acyltransferase n=1 Tax=Thioclava litoralis TaxID=3076557 RepID=A0ABZ1E447_9RHOB|nr:acyltransferase [Thioclava sp. FTW29]
MKSNPAYIPSLDGLRAISIAIVFLSHAGLGHIVPGGFGVTVFFFISGFLITSLLCREYDRYGSISLRVFYLRRVLRLMPPLACAMGLAIVLVLAGALVAKIDIPTLLSQIFFLSNYYQIYGNSQSIPGLGVLWSLAVEEHFYMLWPFIFILFARNIIGFRSLTLALIGFLVWRGIRFYVLGSSENALYYLSDARLDSLLYGCVLALMMWCGYLPRENVSTKWRGALLVGALGVLLVSLVLRDAAFRGTLRYSLQSLALMPVFYYAVTTPDMALFRPLNWPVLRKIGVWSYSIYLVHFVLINLFNQQITGAHAHLISGGLALIGSLVYAAVVYHFVEVPSARFRHKITRRAPKGEPVGA